jgi:adenylate cyclase class IV
MVIEVKARVRGFAEIEQKLRKMEARKGFAGKEDATYFESEGRGGLCIIGGGDSGRLSLAKYNSEGGYFDVIVAQVSDVSGMRRVFSKLFSVIANIKSEKKAYALGGLEVWLAHIDLLGSFIMVRGKGKEDAEGIFEVLDKLGLEPEQLVEEDFGELLTKKGRRL